MPPVKTPQQEPYKEEEHYQQIEQYMKDQKQIDTYNLETVDNLSKIDFKQLIEERIETFLLIKQPNFMNNKIQIKQLPKFGRGIVAKQAIKRGEVLLVEKAFLIGDTDQQIKQIDSYGKQQKFKESCSVFQSLMPDNSFSYEKINLNSFQVGNQITNDDEIDENITATYCTASFFNHSCASNVDVAFLSNLIIVQAKININEGEQICINYFPPFYPTISNYLEQLKTTYNFTCQCGLCSKLKQEAQQIDDTTLTLDSVYDVAITKSNVEDVEKLVKIYTAEHLKLKQLCNLPTIRRRYYLKYVKILYQFSISQESIDAAITEYYFACHQIDLINGIEVNQETGSLFGPQAVQDALFFHKAAKNAKLKNGLHKLAFLLYQQSIAQYVTSYELEDFYAEFFE